MPNLLDRIGAFLRSFRLGPALVTPFESTYGHWRDDYNLGRYGEFLAHSVGVYACANIRANSLSGLKLRLYREGKDGLKKEVTNTPANQLLTWVNPHWTPVRLWRMTELSLCLWGESFWVIERGPSGKGRPKEIWWARPDKMRAVPDENSYLKGYIYEDNGRRIAFTPDEVVWFRYPNPADEFRGLSPLSAARLSVETTIGAMRSNKRIFDRGFQLAGLLTPAKDEVRWTKEQTQELEAMLVRRFSGVDKAHGIGVLSQAANVQSVTLSPKDAEFLGMLRWGLSDVCRVFQVPPMLVMDFEKATYHNADQAYQAFWTDCMTPETALIASEVEEQFLPMFGLTDVHAEFDLSRVSVLQEDKSKLVNQMAQLWAMGVPLNRLLQEYQPNLLPAGKDGYEWGDQPKNGANGGSEGTDAPGVDPDGMPHQPSTGTENDGQEGKIAQAIAIVRDLKAAPPATYGSDDHVALYKAFDRRAARHEAAIQEAVVGLFREQQKDLIEAIASKGLKAAEVPPEGDGDNDSLLGALLQFVEKWRKRFTERILPLLREATKDAGDSVAEEMTARVPPEARPPATPPTGQEPPGVSVGISFDVGRPEVSQFLDQRAQRFADQVNETTWRQLRDTLNEGREAGEGITDLARRVEDTMADRIRSSATTIARTETIGALNGGAIAAARQSGVVTGKTWISTLDDRTRRPPRDAFDHLGAHGETVPLDEPFTRTGEELDYPGADGGSAANICNCRCTLGWVVAGDEEAGPRGIRSDVLTGIARWLRRRSA